MKIETIFDPRTYTLTYIVWDEHSKDAVVIDPVLDFDPLSVRFFNETNDRVAEVVEANGLRLRWILETHAHADHISGSQWLREKFGAKIAIGAKITMIQDFFGSLFNRPDVVGNHGAFDRLLDDGEVLEAGTLAVGVIATPGHTPACVTYRIGDAIFTGDALFMPDFGTGRCDFPKGSADDLYNSVQKLYALPDDTRVFVGHDYQPGGRELRYETTIGESKASNKQLQSVTTREDFVRFRSERDAKLSPPKLIFQSIQANVVAGKLPPEESNGMRYLKLPIGVF
jgi:glyoxylase-like metal-dependent hydrolase (beta-lactamase superfamily II)